MGNNYTQEEGTGESQSVVTEIRLGGLLVIPAP